MRLYFTNREVNSYILDCYSNVQFSVIWRYKISNNPYEFEIKFSLAIFNLLYYFLSALENLFLNVCKIVYKTNKQHNTLRHTDKNI